MELAMEASVLVVVLVPVSVLVMAPVLE